MSAEAAEDMGRIFTRRYPGISITVIRTTGQVAYQRVLQELKNSTPQCDVLCSTDLSHYPALKARNAPVKSAPQIVYETGDAVWLEIDHRRIARVPSLAD